MWFAQPLLSSATEEIRPWIVQTKEWAERLGCRVRRWMSDMEDAFVKTIADVCRSNRDSQPELTSLHKPYISCSFHSFHNNS